MKRFAIFLLYLLILLLTAFAVSQTSGAPDPYKANARSTGVAHASRPRPNGAFTPTFRILKIRA